MPSTRAPSADRTRRREQILALLQQSPVRNQADLQDRLAQQGIEANQATLSRDLRALGVVKGQGGYELPATPNGSGPPGIWLAVRTWLRNATAAENLVVLHTPAGGAQPLGLALDKARLEGVIGTIAGDDTVLAICSDRAKAKRLATRLLAGSDRRPQ